MTHHYPRTPADHNGRRAARLTQPFTDEQWRMLLLRQGYRCYLCGRFDLGLEVEHLIPMATWGGSGAITNILGACRSCNARKGARPIWELRSAREIRALHRRYHTTAPLPADDLRRLGFDLLDAYARGDMRARDALRLILVQMRHPDPDAAMQAGDALVAKGAA